MTTWILYWSITIFHNVKLPVLFSFSANSSSGYIILFSWNCFYCYSARSELSRYKTPCHFLGVETFSFPSSFNVKLKIIRLSTTNCHFMEHTPWVHSLDNTVLNSSNEGTIVIYILLMTTIFFFIHIKYFIINILTVKLYFKWHSSLVLDEFLYQNIQKKLYVGANGEWLKTFQTRYNNFPVHQKYIVYCYHGWNILLFTSNNSIPITYFIWCNWEHQLFESLVWQKKLLMENSIAILPYKQHFFFEWKLDFDIVNCASNCLLHNLQHFLLL